MRRQTRIIVIALVVVAIVSFTLMRSRPADNKVVTPVPLDESTVQFIRPTVVGMLDGIRQWELETERMRERDNLVYMEQIQRGLLYRDGEEYLTFVADTGVWNRDNDELELTGNVTVFRDDERLLDSQRLIWDGNAELLTSPGPVQIQIDGRKIAANEMIGNVKQDELLFKGDVRVQAEGLTLTVADRLIYHVEEGSMQGFGQGQLRLNIKKPGEEKAESEA